MPKMNVKRLTILRDYLKTLPEGVYNQYNYGFYEERRMCGFSHATQIPEFQKLGLKSAKNCVVPEYRDDRGCVAMAKFLGISYDVSAWLSSGGYTDSQTYSPKTMIKRLDAVMEDRIVQIDDPKNDNTFIIIPKKKVKELTNA